MLAAAGCAPVEPASSAVEPAAELRDEQSTSGEPPPADGAERADSEQGVFVELEVDGHNPALVWVPPSASTARPLVVAAHGAWDRAEWYCEVWRAIVEERGFVLCPRGRRTDRRVPHEQAYYYFPDHLALEREVIAALRALRARYGRAVDTRAAVWTGFSQGAIHGALLIARNPGQFPRAALVEGGNGFFNEWSPHAARRYRRGGGERVLFACGSPYCVRVAERCAGFLGAAGTSARVVHARGTGHSYDSAMQAELERSFEWLVADDERWRGR